ncbi:HWE histidine kinase domain-containing protein [Sphingomonas sp.]|uniref:HWE histidine kinase domain-containing protein n=1 Tax=Sphingomonas sp. TaxID=28214 RepID=UPI003CC591C2
MAENDNTTRLAELEADNGRLRRLLDQRDAPGELRHRLQSTLAMLRVIIRKSAETNRNLDAYVNHLEDRVAAVARAQGAADERGSVGLYDLFVDELIQYQAQEGEQVTLSGPEIHFQPRAGQVLALAVHELAVNAVEHGALGAGAGQIEIAWNVAAEQADPLLTIIWKELGSNGVGKGSHEGFGTEVLTRTVAYELKATTALAFEADGLRCTLRFPLTDQIGRVVEVQDQN